MVDLTRRWPLGLGTSRWWIPAAVAAAALALAFAFDREISVWARGWPPEVIGFLRELTRYGESDWILIPSLVLLVLTVAVAWFVRWKLMRTILWQFSALYGFILLGVGLPSIAATLAKRGIGRGRPDHFEEFGLFHLEPNFLDWTFQSFPSGHATTAFALAMVVALLSPRWFYFAMVFAIGIAVSRVAVGAHYTSDVIAGAIVGTLGAYAVRLLFARRGWSFRERPDGTIEGREISSLRRYLILRRRGTATAPR